MATWADIDTQIRREGLRALTIRKSDIGHPREAGAKIGMGLPRGQLSDWRFPARADCSSLHVSEFSGVWSAHVDAKHPGCDLVGHVREDVVPAISRALQAALVIAGDLWGRTASRDAHRVQTTPALSCRASLVLVGVDNDPLSRTIDDITGSLGFSHVYLDPCLAVDGERAIIDFDVRRGVHWSTVDAYAHRPRRRVELPADLAQQILGCAQARIRQPLSIETFGIDESVNCVGMILGCMPWALLEELRALQVGPCISPNTLAAYFEVTQ